MSAQKNTHTDLDALPLPEPTWPSGFFGQLGGDAFTADQIRADRIKVWELAMRKAQEGREPVAEVRLEPDYWSRGHFYEGHRKVIVTLCPIETLPAGTELYTSPPPKSDEPIPVTDDASAVAYLEWALWKFIDMAGTCPSAKVDPRTWAHVMVYAPKSDEEKDALLAARDYVQQALNEHDRIYCRHPDTESDRKLIVDELARVDAALTAQQKGNK